MKISINPISIILYMLGYLSMKPYHIPLWNEIAISTCFIVGAFITEYSKKQGGRHD